MATYIVTMVEVFREVRRVLRKDGVLWLNLGDCYATGAGKVGECPGGGEQGARWRGEGSKHDYGIGPMTQPNRMPQPGLKAKDLCGIPWRVAFALQADGWYLRQDIIWSKPNPMPESVRDRCTKAHEYLFLLSKSERYHFDQDAISDDATARRQQRLTQPTEHPKAKAYGGPNFVDGGISDTRNKRSVWEIATAPFPEAHFATFPPALIEPCILAGCPEKCCAKCGAPWVRELEHQAPDDFGRGTTPKNQGQIGQQQRNALGPPGNGMGVKPTKTIGFAPSCSCDAGTVGGTVLDCFGGAGTTGLVADRLGRNAILIELNESYAEMAKRRIETDAGMFSRVELVRPAQTQSTHGLPATDQWCRDDSVPSPHAEAGGANA